MGLDWKTRGVLAEFRRCQIAGQNTDLVFHCTNGNVSAHQMIFAGISPLFTDLMQRYVVGQELLPLDLNISLSEIRREHMEMVVEMVYTGQVTITKRDYPRFREICQLLDLCVPIGDYDKFFRNQACEDRANSVEAQDPQVRESIPLPSLCSPRVFICGECDALFPLLIALKRHKQRQHGQIGLQDSKASPVETEPLTVTRLKTRANRQRTLETSKQILEIEDFIETEAKDMLEEETQSSDRPASPILLEPSTDPQLKTRPRRQRSLETRKLIVKNGNFPENEDITEREVENTLENESQTSDPPASSIVSEPPTAEPRLNSRPNRQLSSIKGKNSICPTNGERMVKCPDCTKFFFPRQVREHLAIHLRDQLNEFLTKIEFKSGLFKCNSCAYETTARYIMRSHVALAHDMITKFANEAQMKFLDDSKKIIFETRCSMMMKINRKRASSSIKNRKVKEISRGVKCPDCTKLIHATRVPPHLINHLQKPLNKLFTKNRSANGLLKCQVCTFETHHQRNMRYHFGLKHNMIMKCATDAQKKFMAEAKKLLHRRGKKKLLSLKKKKQKQPKTRKQNLENEGFIEMEETDVQMGINNGEEDTTVTDSTQNDAKAIKCPDCLKNIRLLQVPGHLVTHLRKQLDEFMMKGGTVLQGFKCKLCCYTSSEIHNMFRHLGVTHKMVETFANEEQKKFLQDAQRLRCNQRFQSRR